MNPHSFNLKIFTPDKKLYDGEAVSLTLPTQAGEITVLKDHTPLISLISIGEIKIQTPGSMYEKFLVQGGVIDVKQKTFLPGEKDNFEVVVLADQTLDGENLNDLDEEIKRAKETMAANADDVDFAFEESILERNLFLKRLKGK